MSPGGTTGLGRVEAAVRAVLPPTVKTRLRPTGGNDPGFDLRINDVPVEVKWLGQGGLRQARELLERRRIRSLIVVARRLSPGARQTLANAGVGWVDETGAAEIAFGSIVISRSGFAEPTTEKPARWTRAVLGVAEALLCGVKPTVSATAQATRLSVGTCTAALHVLTKLGLLAAGAERGRGSARRIDDANQLLEAYAGAADSLRPRQQVAIGVTWQDTIAGLVQVGERWTRARIVWAATGAVAAAV